MSRRVVLLIFVLSGAAGLIYEVVWARQLVLVFGNTTQAVSAILTGFFGGMAIGSAVGGRIADRVRRPLRLYGLLEIVLVVVVILTPATFRLLHEAYRGAFSTLEETPGALALVRFALALVALGPATVLMGATLPTLTRYLTRQPGQLSEAFGRLYAANTIGAIIGTIAAGFFLIELLGLTGTLIVGATCSATAGIVAVVLDRRRSDATEAEGMGATPSAALTGVQPSVDLGSAAVRERRAATTHLRIGLAVAFISGLTALAYQVTWVRLISSGSGNSTYVFTLILAVFLIGLAGGAVAFNVLRPRIRSTIGVLSLSQVAIALLVITGTGSAVARHLTGPLDLTTMPSELFGKFFVETVVVVLPATFVMGIAFPASSALVADPAGHTGGRAGLLLAVNTTGAIAGTFLVPFVLIPAIGSPGTLAVLAIVNAATGIALALGSGEVQARARAMTSALGLAAIALVAGSLVTAQVFVDPSVVRIRDSGGTVFATTEDEIASVQAGEVRSYPQLWVTGTSMTLLTVDAKLMPLLPLMARPNSKTALVVAFGMGTAYRSALVDGLETDAVELVPSVPKMFGYYYPDATQILSDPEGRVIIADGRNHVELTNRRYDLIVTDPPPPIESSGVSVISSLEYYAAARKLLNPGGIQMQWVPYGQTIDEFKAHLRTFRSVYPNVVVAFGPGGYGFFILGSDEPISLDEANVRTVLARPGVVDDISSAFDSPEHDVAGWARRIPSLVWISDDEVASFAGEGPLITDDRPLPEYFLLRHAFGSPSPQVSPQLLLRLTGKG